MFKRLTPLLAIAGLLWQWNQRRTRDGSPGQRSRAKPVEVTTWEGEGGALPAAGTPPARPPAAT